MAGFNVITEGRCARFVTWEKLEDLDRHADEAPHATILVLLLELAGFRVFGDRFSGTGAR